MKKIKIINKSGFPNPQYATPQSAGLDLRTTTDITIHPKARTLISTGIFLALPEGYEAQIRPRSGLAIKHGITVLNSPGTIDADYRGEIGVILINHGDRVVKFSAGDKIAQLVFHRYEQCDFENVENLDETERGDGGFGHSGL